MGDDNEDEKIDHYCEQVKSTDIEVTEYETPETERNRYEAEFEYKKLHYCLIGRVDKGRNRKYFKKFVFFVIKCVSFLQLMCLLYREP